MTGVEKVNEAVEVTEFDLDESSAIFYMKDGGMKGEGYIELTPVPYEVQRDLRKQCTTTVKSFVKVVGFNQPHKDVEEDFDETKHRKLFWEKAFKGWGKFFDKKHVEIPFTPENIEIMMKVPRFAVFANESYLAMENDIVKGKEEEAEN